MKSSRFVQSTLATGIPFGLCMGLILAFLLNPTIGIAGGIVSGLLTGVMLASFVEVQRKRMEVHPGQQFEGESVLFQGPANHFLNREGRGGWLTLTPTKLCFRSHGKNFQNEPVDIPLGSIAEVKGSRSLGIIPNGLKFILLENGRSEVFVVNGRGDWIQALKQAMQMG